MMRLFATALTCAALGCGAKAPAPTEPLPPQTHNGIATLLSPLGVAQVSELLADRVATQLDAGFVVLASAVSVVDPGSDRVITVPPIEAAVEVLATELSIDAAKSAMSVALSLSDLPLTVEVDLGADGASCAVDWEMVGPEVAFSLDASRDKAGEVVLFIAGQPTVSWSALEIDGPECDATALSVASSKLLASVKAQLSGPLPTSIVPLLAGVVGIDVATSGTAARRRTDGTQSTFAWQIATAIPDNESTALPVDASGVWMPLDFAAASTLHPCVPPIGSPVEVTLPVPALPPGSVPPEASWSVIVSRATAEQALQHLYRAGLLCATVSGAPESGALPLTAGTFAAWMPGLGSFSASMPLRLRVRPAAAPTLSWLSDSAIADDAADAAMHLRVDTAEIAVDVYVVQDTAEVRLYTARAAATVDVEIRAETSTFSLRVADVETSNVRWESPVFETLPGAEAARELLSVGLSHWLHGEVFALIGSPHGGQPLHYVGSSPVGTEHATFHFRFGE
jgi:hypothetical protein